jgi:WD40 repeat protein
MSAPANPFLALESYTREDRDRFFGRDTDLTLVMDRVLTGRTTLLFAPSGAGKTSFLNARLVPELEDRFFVACHNRWSGDAPLALVRASVAAAWRASSWSQGQPDVVDGDAIGLAAIYRSMQPCKPWSGCVLVLDQFEEVFQQQGDTPQLARLVDSIAEIVTARDIELRLVFSMREEFLGELSVFDNRMPDVFNNYYRLRNPNRRVARMIVARTARTAGVDADATLEQLIDDLAGVATAIENPTASRRVRDSVPPPFLQIACHGLWDAQFRAASTPGDASLAKTTGPPTFPLAYRTGQARQYLDTYCGGLLVSLTGAERNWLADALGFLITRRGAKVAYEVGALAEHTGAPEAMLRSVLDKLSASKARLFRRTQAADGSTWYELYHDMYSPFLLNWKAEHRRVQVARRRRLLWAAAGAGLTVLIVLAGVSQYRVRRATSEFQSSLAAANAAFAEQISKPITEFRLRFGQHTDRIFDVGFSPDGLRVASASFDGSARIWDVRRRLATARLDGGGPLRAIAFDPTGLPRVVIAGAGGAIGMQLYDFLAVRRIASFALPKTAYALAFSPDGHTIACGGDDGMLWFVDAATNAIQRVTWPNAVNAMAFTPDGGQVAIGDFGGRVALISPGQPASADDIEDRTLTRYKLSVLAVAISPDGNLIASGGRDLQIRVLDRSGKIRLTLSGHTAAVHGLAFSPDGRVLASAGVDATIRLWDVQTGAELATLLGHANAVYAVAFNRSGSMLVSSGFDRTVRLWDVASRRQVGDLAGEWAEPKVAQFSADLGSIVTERSTQGTQFWSGPRLETTLDLHVTAVGLTRDGQTTAAGSDDGFVVLNRASEPARRFRVLQQGAVRGIVFSGNGDVMAVQAEDTKDFSLFSVPSGKKEVSLGSHHAPGASEVWFSALNETGDFLAVAGSHDVAVFDRRSAGTTPVIFETQAAILRIAYDVFNRLIILHDDTSVEIADATGQNRKTEAMRSLAQSPLAAVSEDARSVAFVESNRRRIHVRGQTGTVVLTLPDTMLALAFSRDGTRLGTLDNNGAVRIYSPWQASPPAQPQPPGRAQATSGIPPT